MTRTMIRTRLTALVFLLSFFSLYVHAQNVTIGVRAGAASTNVLLATSATAAANYSRTASIYAANEINSAGGHQGVISKLWWNKEGTGELTSGNAQLKVYIKPINKSTFSDSVVWATDTVGATLVFSSSTYSIPTGTGWKQLNFTTPYTWNGTDSLAIFVDWFRPSNPTAAINWARSTHTSSASFTSTAARPGAPAKLGHNAFRPILQLQIIDPNANDASTLAITRPLATINSGTDSVMVKVRNWGGQPLSSVTLNWEIDGAVQPTVAHAFTPALAATDSSASIKISNFTFTPGYHTIRTWTSMPNGLTDDDRRNDTLTTVIWVKYPAFSGTYTINNTLPAVLPNFPDFNSALRALNESGISGSVIFEVPANSTFREVNLLISTTGTATDSIVFRKTGTGNNPLIITSAGATTKDFVFGFDGADYITIDGINIEDSDPAFTIGTSTVQNNLQTEYGYMFFRKSATDGAQHNTIRNSSLRLRRAGRSTLVGIYLVNENTAAATTNATSMAGTHSFNNFYNDSVIDCYTGISLNGTNDSNYYDEGNKIGVDGGNVVINFGGSNISTEGIYATNQDNLKIANNRVICDNSHSTGLVGISTAAGLNSNVDIYNNTVTVVSSGTSLDINAILNAMGNKGRNNTVNITNNKIIGSASTSTGARTSEFVMIKNTASATMMNISNNLIENDSATNAGTIIGIVHVPSSSETGGVAYIYSNIVRNIKRTGSQAATAGHIYGIASQPNPGNQVYTYNNSIYNLDNSSTVGGVIAGVQTSSSGSQHIYRNNIYNLRSTSATNTTRVIGCYNLTTSSTATGTYFYNNMISGLTASSSAHADAIAGISFGASNATMQVGIYYNTIVIDSAASSPTFGSSGISVNSGTAMDIRNNIVINKSIPGSTSGIVAAYRRSSTALASYSDSSDHNIFHVNTLGNRKYIYYDGSDSATSMGAFKGKMGTRDQHSIGVPPQFVNSTTLPYDLRIDSLVITPVEGTARPVTLPVAVTTDFFGNLRSTTTPDIGAHEGNFISGDLEGPAIAFAALKNTASLLNRTITATISDASGVDSLGTGKPLLYYNKNGSGYLSVPATSRSGSEFTFTIDYALMGGIAQGDVVRYYIAAQDLSPSRNPSSNPDGAQGSNPPGVVAPALTASYTILQPLSGVFYVGTSPHTPPAAYATIKSALQDYNTKGLAGATTFILIDSTYNTSTGETFPLVLDENPDASPVNTLLIRPATGVNVRIADAAPLRASIIKLNGADHVTINGINTAGTSLTIVNQTVIPHEDSLNAVIWISSAGAGNGATFNTIKNCNIHGAGYNSTQMVIYSGSAISSGYLQFIDANNNNLVIDSNYISKARHGVAMMGSSTANPATGNRITNNRIGSPLPGDGFYWHGVHVTRQDGIVISGNDVQNGFSDVPANADKLYGINLVTSRNSAITGNKVHNLRYIGTTTNMPVFGINVSAIDYKTAARPANNLVANNAIYDLVSTASFTGNNISGINLSDGYGERVYHNTVYLTGQLSGGGPSAAFTLGHSSILGNSPTVPSNIDVRNNIFAVTGNIGTTALSGKLYAIHSKDATYTSGLLDRNILYVNVPAPAAAHIAKLYITDYTNLAAWQTVSGQDATSLAVNPMLNTPQVLIPDVTSPVLGAGVALAGITTDINGNPRSVTAPSIGAYETGGDFRGPSISFAPLKNTTLTTNITATDFATIADNAGVNTTAGTKPRIYYKKAGDQNAYNGNTSLDNGWKYTEATNAVSPFSFGIDYSLLLGGTTSLNDTIQYFIVAQDNMPTTNVGSNAAFFNTAQSVNLTPINFPASGYSSYRIIPGAQGYVYVGAAQPYTNLTDSAGLFDALKNSLILTGDLTVLVTSNLTENGTNDISGWQEEGPGGYRVTIRPDQPVQRTISGSVANGLIRLNKARKVTFDGIDTVSGTGKYLRFVNFNTSNPVFTFINDATNDTIRNCVIAGASTNSSNALVFFTSASNGGNNFNAVTDNILTNAGVTRYNNGIYSGGGSVHRNNSNTLTGNIIRNFSGTGVYISSNSGDRWNISSNTLYDSILPPATTEQNGIEFYAQSKNNLINDNRIGVPDTTWYTSGNNAFTGITASFDVTGPNEVRRNIITNIERGGTTTAASFAGIRISRGTVSVSNNVIGDTLNLGKGIRVMSPAVSTGIDITSTVANATITVTDNQVAGMVSGGTAATTRLRGISYANTSTANTLPVTIAGNKVYNLKSYSSVTGLFAGEQSVTGIYLNPNSTAGTYAEVNVSNNTLYNLAAGNTSDTATVAVALMLNNVKGTVNANRIYAVRNHSARNSATNPATATGIMISAADQVVISNNMITNSIDTVDYIQYIGIWNPATTLGARLVYNTVLVKGFNLGSAYSYAVYRGNNNPADLVNTPFNGNNNLLISTREGANSYAIGSNGTSGFGSQSWNNNVYNSFAISMMGNWNGTNHSLFTWKTASAKDSASKTEIVLFNDPYTGNLHLSGSSVGNTQLAGVNLPGFTKDFDGDTRHIYPYVGADENTGAPLPVKLTSFNAVAVNKDVFVQWTTAAEKNTSHFAIEVSVDGKTFRTAGRVAAKGNSSVMLSYGFKHADAQRELNNAAVAYYRLRAVDADGTSEVSKIAEVRFNAGKPALEAATAYPNPFTEQVILSVPAGAASEARIEVLDMQGRTVLTSAHDLAEGINTITLTQTAELREGIYFIRLTTPEGNKVMKMMKQ